MTLYDAFLCFKMMVIICIGKWPMKKMHRIKGNSGLAMKI